MYIKPGKTFNLTKRNKTMVALLKFRSDDSRHEFKNMMIQAQLSGEVRIKAEPRKSFTGGVPNLEG